MNIKETFLKFTDRTYPYGTEQELFHLMPNGYQKDELGNLYYQIGDSDTMFTAHLDTATKALTEVKHVFEGDIIKTDGKSILGADDKAGLTVMLYMMSKNVPGLYYFFLGEEVGCIGSRGLADIHKTKPLERIKKVISFDRRGLDSVITFQSSGRCCSEEFGQALAAQLNKNEPTFKYTTDPTGVYTDSAQFISIYPECTNISVGYYNEHTTTERQDIKHLEKLAQACCLVDWESLPVKRDPAEVEYRSYGGYSGYGSYVYGYDEDGWESWESNYSSKKSKVNEIVYFYDYEYHHLSSYEIDNWSGKMTKIDLDIRRVQMEEDLIQKFLEDIELNYKTMKWDGNELRIKYGNDEHTEVKVTPRYEITEYIEFMNPDFDLVKLAKKCEEEEEKTIKNYRSTPDYSGLDF